MGEVSNCPRCNAIFLKGAASICPECKKKEEQDFQTVYTFMRKKQNRMATVQEIEEKTGVSEKQIRDFVKQRRLHPAQFPNLTYDCEKCGAGISEGRICDSCKDELSKGLKQHERNEELDQRMKEEELRKSRTYYSVRNDR